MGAIQSHTTTNGDLPYYYYIVRNMESLGTEMKHMACARLGTMLYLDIQKWKEARNTSEFQKDIRDTTMCTMRLDIDT